MSNLKLKNVVYSVIAACTGAMMFVPCISCALLMEIPCCNDPSNPTKVLIKEKPGVAQGARVVGSRLADIDELPPELRMNIVDDEWKDIIMPSENHNYDKDPRFI
jgi:hypothetical protein